MNERVQESKKEIIMDRKPKTPAKLPIKITLEAPVVEQVLTLKAEQGRPSRKNTCEWIIKEYFRISGAPQQS
jgi:hypothetical protein